MTGPKISPDMQALTAALSTGSYRKDHRGGPLKVESLEGTLRCVTFNWGVPLTRWERLCKKLFGRFGYREPEWKRVANRLWLEKVRRGNNR